MHGLIRPQAECSPVKDWGGCAAVCLSCGLSIGWFEILGFMSGQNGMVRRKPTIA